MRIACPPTQFRTSVSNALAARYLAKRPGVRWQSEAATPLSDGIRCPKAAQGCRTPRRFACSVAETSSHQAAFTLLELLLATAIFSIVVIAINTVFFAALHLRKATTDALDTSLPVEQALSILRKDLQNAVNPGGVLAGHFRNGGPSSGSGFGTTGLNSVSGSSSTASQTGAGTSLAGSAVQGGLDFFTTTGVVRDYEVGGDIQEVNYQLMEPLDPEALGSDLVRSVTRNLLSFSTPIPETQRLLSNIELLEFQFYDGMEWREFWDTTLTDTNLPTAVRIRLLQAVPPEYDHIQREPLELIVRLQTTAVSGVSASTEETTETGGEQ